MRFSKLYVPTLKEDPSEAEVISHRLMVRAGLLRKVASGIYTFLPLGYRVLNKVSQIVREEMNRIGAQEILMPALQPAEIWQKSGRWYEYGPEMMRLKDRNEREFCLGPTHEELITSLIMNEVRSYRELPIILYQIQVKFRDEIRPRFGVVRAREFIMKDAYSFDADQAGMEKSYQKMYEAYSRIIKRCGLEYRAVEADPGIIGGHKSQEFMVLAQSGEDIIVYCDRCNYAANREAASHGIYESKEEERELKKIHTPGKSSVKEVSSFLGIMPQQLVKTLIYKKEKELIAILVRGDREVNDLKLSRYLGTNKYKLLSEDEFSQYQLEAGFVGPIGMKEITLIGDEEVRGMRNFVIGANETDYHYLNANVGRDFLVGDWVDLTFAQSGDRCPRCEGQLQITRGIEVGHVFQLGTKYSESMQANFLDEAGKLKPFVMGCYGIGVSRLVAAAIEQHHDERGIVWPLSLAPFEVAILILNWEDKNLRRLGEELYRKLEAGGAEVILDDRLQSPGVKFADADLIGFPLQLIVGARSYTKGKVEIKLRCDGSRKEVDIEKVEGEVLSYLKGRELW